MCYFIGFHRCYIYQYWKFWIWTLRSMFCISQSSFDYVNYIHELLVGPLTLRKLADRWALSYQFVCFYYFVNNEKHILFYHFDCYYIIYSYTHTNQFVIHNMLYIPYLICWIKLKLNLIVKVLFRIWAYFQFSHYAQFWKIIFKYAHV